MELEADTLRWVSGRTQQSDKGIITFIGANSAHTARLGFFSVFSNCLWKVPIGKSIFLRPVYRYSESQ